ncbi:hypothetical protein [Polaromonas sp. C04]|uniref:hypothetical protein n=1 Tax=Polaromonas sp. C04 TaxID=1945857 RepID=UPI000986A869|nr:hypothetical protein [Polaromonas sp. C04]OOG58054.1 hypothetical protein B0E49_04285 [Polaromonas sp. C04]
MPIPNIPEVWPIADISMRPSVTLSDWQAFEVQMRGAASRTRHFVGYCLEDRAGQVSSAVQEFDARTMRGIANSGRVYVLRGKAGRNADAESAWRHWVRLNGATDLEDISQYLKRMLKP